MFKRLSPALFLLSITFFTTQAFAADLLVNNNQLKKVFYKVVDSWDIETAKEIKHYQNIKSVNFDGIEGYSSGLTFQVRAQMFANTAGDSVKVFALPATAYFPDNPEKNPLIIEHKTVEVPSQVQDKVLDSAEVKVPLNGMSGKKSLLIVYGQTVLKNTKTTITADGEHFIVKSTIDISKMDEKDAKKYFESFQSIVSSLNAELNKMSNVHLSDWYDKETEQAEDNQKDLKKQSFSEITDKNVFMSIVGWQLNSTNQVKEPVSKLGHWSYEDPYANDDYNVTVEVINYGTYYEMLYLISYDRALDEGDNKDKLDEMIAKINKYLSKKIPKGAKTAIARTTNYYGTAEVVATYSLENSPKGKEIYANAEAFSKFLKKTHNKIQKIADKAG